MKFSDNVKRNNYKTVFVIRNESLFEQTEEYNSLLWEVERYDFPKKGENLYSIPVRDVKIGESIYDKSGRFVAYRSE